ncbi:MAG: tetratricopeptide repeat protein [Candidatus Obscuribacterales bacterium]|nr:tetratricopeptide repeat protein [Candidatus Obscuribacterales bacterium]
MQFPRILLIGAATVGIFSTISIACHSSQIQDRRNQDEYSKLAYNAAKCIDENDFENAIRLLQKAITVARKRSSSEEAALNSSLSLAYCLVQTKSYAAAENILNQIESDLQKKPAEFNPALSIRLRRRKVELYLAMEQASKAANEQEKLCDLYRKNVGLMVVHNFAEMVTLADLEREAGNVDKSYEISKEAEKLMTRFHLAKDAQLWQHLYANHGINACRKGFFDEANHAFEKGLEHTSSDEVDFKAHFYSLLVICNKAAKNERLESQWLSRLNKEISKEKIQKWLDQSRSELKTDYSF